LNVTLLHEPQDVLRKLLVDLLMGVHPTTSPVGDWPIYCNKEPNLPDNCLTVFGDQGLDSGRVMQGDRIQFPGFQIRARSNTPQAGYVKMSAICVAIDNDATRQNVTMADGTVYRMKWVTRDRVMPLNQNKPNSRNYVHVLNGSMSLVRVP
jgi:hypothetical protein